jgi:hypothetical protein
VLCSFVGAYPCGQCTATAVPCRLQRPLAPVAVCVAPEQTRHDKLERIEASVLTRAALSSYLPQLLLSPSFFATPPLPLFLSTLTIVPLATASPRGSDTQSDSALAHPTCTHTRTSWLTSWTTTACWSCHARQQIRRSNRRQFPLLQQSAMGWAMRAGWDDASAIDGRERWLNRCTCALLLSLLCTAVTASSP